MSWTKSMLAVKGFSEQIMSGEILTRQFSQRIQFDGTKVGGLI